MARTRILRQSTVFVATLLLCLTPLVGQESQLAYHFDDDQRLPLEIKEIGVERRGRATVYDLSYASPLGGRVPAYLIVPTGKGPFAAVMWGHWYWSNSPMRNRKEFLDDTG